MPWEASRRCGCDFIWLAIVAGAKSGGNGRQVPTPISLPARNSRSYSAKRWPSTQSLSDSDPPADRPDCHRVLPSELNFFRFMVDHEAFALTKRVFHLFQTDFDFQPLAAVCHRKPKCSAFLRRATWPE